MDDNDDNDMMELSETGISSSIIGHDLLQFVDGFADGLSSYNIEVPLEECWKTTKIDMEEIKEAVEFFKTNKTHRIVEGLKKLVSTYKAIKDTLAPCVETLEDLRPLVEALEIVITEFRKHTIVIKIGKSIVIHRKDIFNNIKSLIESVKEKDYKGIGLELGDIVKELLLS